MARVSFYVDGFNLYHAIRKLQRPELKWLYDFFAVRFLSRFLLTIFKNSSVK